MDALLHVGLANALTASLLALLALAVSLFARGRPALRHSLWLLVLLKLVTPPLVHVPIPCLPPSGDGEAPAASAPAPAAALPPRSAIVAPPTPPPDPSPAAGPGVIHLEALRVEEPPAPPPAAEPSPAPPGEAGWLTALAGLWLAGSLLWLGVALLRVLRFERLLRAAGAAPEALASRVARLAARLDLRRVPTVRLVSARIPPMIWSFLGRPRLLLPAQLWHRLTAEQQDTLLVHELAHLRRRDHWTRLLEMAVLALHWWNPIAWYACRELREAEEQCCDAWVVSLLPGESRSYAEALVDTLDFLSSAPPPVPVLASGIGHVTDLKRRLHMILCGSAPRALTWRGSLAVVLLGALLLPALPGRAQDGPDPDRKGPPPADPEKQQRLRAEIEKARDQLEQARRQLEEHMERVHQAERRLREAEEKLAPGERSPRPPLPGRTLILEIPGEGPRPGGPRMIWRAHVEGHRPDVIIFRRQPGPPEHGPPGPGIRPPGGRPEHGPEGPPHHAGPLPHPGDARRIEHLERRLDDVLRELERMRHDMRPPRPGEGPPPPPDGRRPEPPRPAIGEAPPRPGFPGPGGPPPGAPPRPRRGEQGPPVR